MALLKHNSSFFKANYIYKMCLVSMWYTYLISNPFLKIKFLVPNMIILLGEKRQKVCSYIVVASDINFNNGRLVFFKLHTQTYEATKILYVVSKTNKTTLCGIKDKSQ